MIFSVKAISCAVSTRNCSNIMSEVGFFSHLYEMKPSRDTEDYKIIFRDCRFIFTIKSNPKEEREDTLYVTVQLAH